MGWSAIIMLGEVEAMIETDDNFRLMPSSAIAALSFSGHCEM
jgi:hypothetical protein